MEAMEPIGASAGVVPPRATSGADSPRTALRAKIRRWREAVLGYAFLLPSLALFALFLFYPMLRSMYLSVHITDPRGRVADFVGLDNYVELFTTGRFFDSLKITALFTLYTVPTGILFALILAALTFSKLRGMKGFQFVFSLPVSISVGTASVIFLLLFHPSVGMLNYFLGFIGVAPINWLTDPAWALVSISLMTVWMHLGFHFIVLLSGLQGIPQDILDSAKIDGSGPLRTFRTILVPLLSPTLFFLAVVSVIGSFQAFGQVHILTKGGPTHATDVVVYSLYREAFVNFQFGTGSAQALVLFAIILVLTAIQFKVLERKVHYQ